MHPLRACLGFLLLATPTVAQVDRHELGLRLRAFERRLAAVAEPERRAAAFAALDRAVQAFFRLDQVAVARAIAAADEALAPAVDARVHAVVGTQLTLARRLHDPADGGLPFTLSAAFAVEAPWPQAVQLEVALAADGAPRVAAAVAELPFEGVLPVTAADAGDHELVWTLRSGECVLQRRTQGVSLATGLRERLAALEAAADAVDPAVRTPESLSLPLLARLAAGMTRTRAEETVLPGARLLAQAEELAAAVAAGQPWHGPARVGQHWLRLPVGKAAATLRLLVPDGAHGPDGPRPLVLALHGAGGSENLFFDGYGDGAIVAACRQRGFYLAAPRLGVLGAFDAEGLVDALAGRWSIDRERVLLVGHSMGAAQAIAALGRAPGRFAAVAALGGGGSVRAAAVRTIPCFVGIGERDFARTQALALHRDLIAAGAGAVLRRYDDVEHLAIVQVALPDVFAFFDRVLAAR